MSGTNQTQKLKVFISYARRDGGFAEDLLAALNACGFEPYLDKRDIEPGEPWENRLEHLIQSADTVVFVISPTFVTRERCGWEIDQATRLGKRLMPVIWEAVPESGVPEKLRRLNYVYFSGPERSFAKGLADLAHALNTDIDWIRQHTDYAELAARWQARDRAEALLMRGDEIAIAKAWAVRQPKDAPEPTLLQREFFHASEKAEQERLAREAAQAATAKDAEVRRIRAEQDAERSRFEAAQVKASARRRRGQAVMAALLGIGAVGAGLGWREIDRARVIADYQKREAELSKREADAQRRLAESERKWSAAQAQLPAAGEQARIEAQTSGEAKPPPPPSATPTRDVNPITPAQVAARMSPASVDMMMTFEIGGRAAYDRQFSKPVWPGFQSGVVIGAGYDLGYTSRDDFQTDWSASLKPQDFERLTAVLGVTGEPAKALAASLSDIQIPWEAAESVFRNRTLIKYAAQMERAFPNARELPPDCYGALVSLIYNRGPGMSGEKRTEMRAIRDQMEKKNFAGIPEQLRAMKRLWPELSGLQQRRETEAILFERGLAGQAAQQITSN